MNEATTKTLFILSNSPGEVSGWLAPVVSALSRAKANVDIICVALPCPYASGAEANVAGSFAGVSKVVALRRAFALKPRTGKKIILQLGGDPMYGRALSFRLKAPWLIYTARPKWRGAVTRYFLPDDAAAARFKNAGVAEERFSVVGNLILDSTPERSSIDVRGFRKKYGENLICFMPGSRPFEYEEGAAFFARVAETVREKYPSLQAVMPLAPTVEDEILARGLKKHGMKWRGVDAPREIVMGEYKIPFVREERYAAVAASSLVVAFPGTNNLQAAALGAPLLVLAPLIRAAEIPLDGIFGLIPHKPPLLALAKKKLVFRANDRVKFVSLPNRMANREIALERRELMTPESASRYVARLLEDEPARDAIIRGYSTLNLRRGASYKIASRIKEEFEKP